MEIAEKLIDIFERKGIFVDEEELNEELQIDSIQFVSLIIAIEEEFSIEFDDDMYSIEKLRSFNDYVNVVEKLLK